jgi:hypothetical protein
MAALLLVSAWTAAPCRTAKASGAFAIHSGGYHTIETLKLRNFHYTTVTLDVHYRRGDGALL